MNKIDMNQEDQERRRKIVDILYEKYKQEYPQYQTNYAMVPPKVPPTLKNVDLSKKEMEMVAIKDLQKSVICGTCVGDSSLRISRGYRNARIQSRQSTKQAAWFFWKWTFCLKEYINGLSSITFQYPDGFQEKMLQKDGSKFSDLVGKLKVSTKADLNLTKLHSLICESNQEKIQRFWLNHMTDYFLMTLWLDDGSLFNKRQGQICLDSTPLDQQKVFVDYLKAVWDIEAYYFDTNQRMSNGKPRYRIRIKNKDNLLKLLRIVAPIIPVKEMLYKVMFVPHNDTDLLQRWASEVSELVLPEFREFIKEEYRVIIASYETDSEEDIVQI